MAVTQRTRQSAPTRTPASMQPPVSRCACLPTANHQLCFFTVCVLCVCGGIHDCRRAPAGPVLGPYLRLLFTLPWCTAAGHVLCMCVSASAFHDNTDRFAAPLSSHFLGGSRCKSWRWFVQCVSEACRPGLHAFGADMIDVRIPHGRWARPLRCTECDVNGGAVSMRIASCLGSAAGVPQLDCCEAESHWLEGM